MQRAMGRGGDCGEPDAVTGLENRVKGIENLDVAGEFKRLGTYIDSVTATSTGTGRKGYSSKSILENKVM